MGYASVFTFVEKTRKNRQGKELKMRSEYGILAADGIDLAGGDPDFGYSQIAHCRCR